MSRFRRASVAAFFCAARISALDGFFGGRRRACNNRARRVLSVDNGGQSTTSRYSPSSYTPVLAANRNDRSLRTHSSCFSSAGVYPVV